MNKARPADLPHLKDATIATGWQCWSANWALRTNVRRVGAPSITFLARPISVWKVKEPDPGDDYRLRYILSHKPVHITGNALSDILQVALEQALARAIAITAGNTIWIRSLGNETGSGWSGACASRGEFCSESVMTK